jgi:hypothetical protein
MSRLTFKDDSAEQEGSIENKTLGEVRQTPLDLPAAFEWYDIDVNSEEDVC